MSLNRESHVAVQSETRVVAGPAPKSDRPKSQYTLRLLTGIVTLWCGLIALAVPSWPSSLPLLGFAALLTVSMLGLGNWLSRRHLLCRAMAVIATLSVTISFELPVLVLTIFSPSQHNGWETFVGGLEMPSASFMDATWLWQNHSMGWLMLISWTGSAYGTILTYLTLATAFWSRENRCKSIGRLVSGMTVVCAAGTASFFFNDGSPTGALKGPLLGYYLWLLGLGGIWLAHAPQRNKVGWTHFAAVAGLLALIASAMKSTG